MLDALIAPVVINAVKPGFGTGEPLGMTSFTNS
jgi:hypothetical protein